MSGAVRILLVEDDLDIANALIPALRRYGLMVTHVRTAADALAADPGDLVLLDLGLPDGDGINVCRQIRTVSDVPVIAVTARGEAADRVRGLRSGADDYVVKPFAPRELVARVRAVLRRTQAEPEQGSVVTAGRIALEPASRTCTLDGVEVDLTRLEFDLLAELASHPRTVYTRERLLEKVWGHQTPVGGKTVDVHVANLRRKLDGWGGIVAVRGVGYKLDPEAA
jgi:DNA-binding response OmpR family regulator